MRKIMVTALAAAVLSIGGIAWAAGPPYTVSVGGSSASGSHSWTAASTGGVRFSFKNNSGTILTFNCTAVSMAGKVTSGTAVNPFGAVTSSVFSGCTFIGGAATLTQVGTWGITGTGSNATTGTESVAGHVSNMEITWATTANPAICSFVIKGATSTNSGQASGSFDEATQRLVISETGYTGNLRIYNVVGCLGQFQNGNPVDFQATLNVVSPDGAINLS